MLRDAMLAPTDADRQRAYFAADAGLRPATHPVVAAFARQRWTWLGRGLPLGEIRTALDVGCGNGASSVHAPAGLAVTGCDASGFLLAAHPGPRRVRALAPPLPFPDRAFDLVYCWELLHHAPEPRRILAEMARVTRRWVVVFEPNRWNPAQAAFACLDREHRWVLRYGRRYLVGEIRAAGLVPRLHRRVGWLFPNRTPGWLAPVLGALPFVVPGLGISHAAIAEVAR